MPQSLLWDGWPIPTSNRQRAYTQSYILCREVCFEAGKVISLYTKLQSQVLPYVNDRAPLLSFVSKMLNKLIGERDWSEQEVSHILLQVPVQKSLGC